MANSKISALTSATTPLAGTETLPIVQSSTTKQVSVANLTAGRAVAVGSLSTNGAGTGANLNTKPNTYGLGTAMVPAFVMESNASGGTATLPSSQGAVVWGTAASPTASINSVQTNPSASSRTYLSFSSTANGTYQETFRIGDFGDINVPIGNVVPSTAAKGINFTANTPAAGKTTQLLNWYEEGTWTLTITATSGSFGTVSGTGTYTRIGRTVYIDYNILIAGNGTAAGAILVTGLPYNAAFSFRSYGLGSETDVVGFNIASQVIGGTNYFYLSKLDGTYPGGNGYRLQGSFTYKV